MQNPVEMVGNIWISRMQLKLETAVNNENLAGMDTHTTGKIPFS